MKAKVKSLPCLRVTMTWIEYDGSLKPQSKICHKAKVAAEFYACVTNSNWWALKGQHIPRPQAYADLRRRRERLERRVLRVFRKYLP